MNLKVNPVKDGFSVVINDSETKEDNGRCELFFIMLCHVLLLRQEQTSMPRGGHTCDTRLSMNCNIFRDVELALECKPYHVSMKREGTSCTVSTWTRVSYEYTIVLQDKRKEPDFEDMERLLQQARELANISKRRVVKVTQPIRKILPGPDGAW